MALELAALVDPAHTALVTQECQKGVIGSSSPLPELAEAAARVDMVAHIAKLVQAARSAGATVIHCLAERRADGLGANHNARIFRYMAKAPVALLPGSEAASLVPDIPTTDSDLVLTRLHGVSPFHGTELDWVLRNEGITTVVGVGVSVNVAIPNLAFDCVNAGYQFVVPRDAVAGTPEDYVDMVFAHTLPVVATVTTTRALLEAWAP
jgi:nicotinamidase-related amidase